MIEGKTAVPDRALEDSTHTASVSFYEDGAIVDPGAVTVKIEREDGTTLVAAGTATSGTGAAARTYALTTTHTATLDRLTLTWTSATKGVLVTYVEVVGGFLFSVADARALKPLDNTTTYPLANVLVARTLAETALEDACSVAFVPRYGRDKFDGSGGVDILLPPRITAVTSASVDGTGLTAAELADLELYRDGRLYHSSKWTEGRRNVEVKFTHGYPYPPPRVGRACLLLAKHFLVDSPISDRTTLLTNDDGTQQTFITAGVRQAVFSIPEANAVVQEYGLGPAVG